MDALEDQDESVRIAVRALGAMRASKPVPAQEISTTDTRARVQRSLDPTPALSVASSSSLSSPTSSTANTPLLPDDRNPYVASAPGTAVGPDYDVYSRVSGLPLVGSALKVYEQGKASSRVVKYGAEMVESSISTLSRPVMDRFCRSSSQTRPQSPTSSTSELGSDWRANPWTRDDARERSVERGGDATVDRGVWRYRSQPVPDSDFGSDVMTPSSDRPTDPSLPSPSYLSSLEIPPSAAAPGSSSTPTAATPPEPSGSELAPRSRWQTVLLEASGIGAAVTVSDENLRRLRYALGWLGYATAHIDAQILVLRDFIASLQPQAGQDGERNVPPAQMRTLTDVRRDLVSTIRQAVDVVSKYAGGALPEPARDRVRGFILHLPQRWARAAGGTPTPRATSSRHAHEVSSPTSHLHPYRMTGHSTPYSRPTSPNTSAPTSPIVSPNHSRRGSYQDLPGLAASSVRGGASRESEAAVPVSQATQAAQRILTLATESLDMMRGVTGVVKDSLERADTWIERMRAVGIQRQAGQDADEGLMPGADPGSSTTGVDEESATLAPLTFPSSPRADGGLPSLRASTAMGQDSPVSQSFGGLSLRSGLSSGYATPKASSESARAGPADDMDIDR